MQLLPVHRKERRGDAGNWEPLITIEKKVRFRATPSNRLRQGEEEAVAGELRSYATRPAYLAVKPLRPTTERHTYYVGLEVAEG